MRAVVSHLPASNQRLEIYHKAQSEDPQCQLVLQYCHEGWPDVGEIDPSVRTYWDIQGELTVGDGLLMRGQRIVVPKVLQNETLKKLHDGHLGMVRCRQRAKSAVWWPELSKQLTKFVQRCPECAQESKPSKEPLIPTPLPEYPWQQVARFVHPQWIRLSDSSGLLLTLSRGHPAEIYHLTISHQCSHDPHIALLSYRATPLPWCRRSPAELLISRNIHSTLPQTTDSLVTQWPYLLEFKQTNEVFKRKQKTDYDRRHRARELLTFQTTLIFG